MKTRTLFLLIIAWFIILGTNCKKEKPTYYMPQEFKDYVMFPEGSYWVYLDSISNNIDSVSIINITIGFDQDNHQICDCIYEQMTQIFYSSFYNSNYTYNAMPSFFDARVYHLRNVTYLLFVNPYEEQSYLSFEYKYFNAFSVRDSIYYKVMMFSNSQYNAKIKQQDIYFSKKIGIIKRKIITTDNDTIVWELKHYNINN